MRPVLCLLATCAVLAGVELPADRDLLPALTPAGAAELARAGDLPRLGIAARVVAEDGRVARVEGRLRLRWSNRGAQAQPAIVLRLIANGEPYAGAAMRVEDVRVGGAPAATRLSGHDTVLHIDLPAPLAPGAVAVVDLAFVHTLSPIGHHGLCRSGEDGAVLYYWHPEPAGLGADGWLAGEPHANGDASQTDAFHLAATLDLPDGLVAIAGGSQVGGQALPEGGRRLVLAAPFTRNHCLVLVPASEGGEDTVGGVRVRAWWRSGQEQAGRRMLAAAASALGAYDAAFGSYPFAECDVVSAPLDDEAGGMESSGLVLIGSAELDAAAAIPAGDPPVAMPAFALEMVTAHEVAHQWWYGLVGSDAIAAPWLDESLTNWCGYWWMEGRYPPGPFALCLTEFLATGRPLGSLELPLAGYSDSQLYGGTVYSRGALAWQALRRRVGDTAMLALLRTWQARHRFGLATAGDLDALIAERLGDGTAAWFRDHWRRGDGLTLGEVVQAAAPLTR